ncbi:hypothetical protein V5799_017188 [Amblyomma americanum]|uniref:Uncharacterized protein n=1 Tax=Amblyomma americanum TaxID=6943 RepID=A0AAQ4F2V7_AMBAM
MRAENSRKGPKSMKPYGSCAPLLFISRTDAHLNPLLEDLRWLLALAIAHCTVDYFAAIGDRSHHQYFRVAALRSLWKEKEQSIRTNMNNQVCVSRTGCDHALSSCTMPPWMMQ